MNNTRRGRWSVRCGGTLDEPKYDAKFSGDVPAKGCVVDKINEFRLVFKDKTKTVEERRFALGCLIP